MSSCLSVLRSFLTVRLLALTSTRINADNGAVASVAINRHRCCANAPRPLARPFPLLPSESFDWLIRSSCRYVVCTVTLSYAVYALHFGPNYDGILRLHCRLIRQGTVEKFQGQALIDSLSVVETLRAYPYRREVTNSMIVLPNCMQQSLSIATRRLNIT